MYALVHFDLFAVGLTIAATLVLGFSVYYSDRSSSTNRMFFAFALTTGLWGITNYLSYQFADPVLTLWLLRGILFFIFLQAIFLFEFFTVFPNAVFERSRVHKYLVIPGAAVLALLTLTPHGFSGVVGKVTAGEIALAQKGQGFWVIAAAAFVLVAGGLYRFVRTYRSSEGGGRAVQAVFAGTAITVGLIVVFDLVFAMVLGDPEFVPYGAFFMLPLIASVAYAVIGESLLDVKVAATSLLVFVLSVISFGEIVFAETNTLIVFRTLVFILVLVYGVNLIKSVYEEVDQRSRIEKLAGELQQTTERQEVLMHFISHEMKGVLAKDAGAFAALADGDMGVLPENAKTFAAHALEETRGGVTAVMDILEAGNQKKGTIEYRKEPFDLAEAAKEIIEKERPHAESKGLAYTFSVDPSGAPYTINGDRGELEEHVLRNLIENAINYTPSGSVDMSLSKKGNALVFAVKDTGIGISDEDRGRLFTEGGHGVDSRKINVHSTGYGLFIAKNIIDAHGGTIRAESDGPGKGSTFIVELPA